MSLLRLQGSDDVATTPGEAPGLVLVPPDRSRSTKPWIQGYWTWAGVVYSLRAARDVIKYIVDGLAMLKCPCDPICVSQNICNAVQGLIISVFTIILKFTSTVGFLRKKNHLHLFLETQAHRGRQSYLCRYFKSVSIYSP